MKLPEAVARWQVCEYGVTDTCRKCKNYIMVDPRTPYNDKSSGPGQTGYRSLCSLLEDLDKQINEKTK